MRRVITRFGFKEKLRANIKDLKSNNYQPPNYYLPKSNQNLIPYLNYKAITLSFTIQSIFVLNYNVSSEATVTRNNRPQNITKKRYTYYKIELQPINSCLSIAYTIKALIHNNNITNKT